MSKVQRVKKNRVISLKGVRQNNLKNFDLEIPLQKMTVVTGPSGSGKSSLAFRTLYAEGQRRYVETFSPYVRQFFDRMDKPAVDKIDGIPPAIAIEQKNAIRTSRSTVGTLTEVNDYLKLFFARVARGYDRITGEEIISDHPDSIADWAFSHQEGESVLVCFPIEAPPVDRSIEEYFEFLQQQGYVRVLINGVLFRTDAAPTDLAEFEELPTALFVVQDRIKVTAASRSRMIEALERALLLGKGICQFFVADPSEKKSFLSLRTFSDQWYNPETGCRLTPPSPGLFSFNSPVGACGHCRGFGRVIGIDLQKAIPDPSLSISQGCVKPFQGERGGDCQRDLIRSAEEAGVDLNTPFADLLEHEQEWVLYGDDGLTKEGVMDDADEAVPNSERLWLEGRWYGVKGFFDWLEGKAYKMHVRVFLARYRSYTECPTCRGRRLQSAALDYKVNGVTLPELWDFSLKNLIPFFTEVAETDSRVNGEKTIQLIFHQITNRLSYLQRVGLDYLTLNRPARTLSGGEIARVNLTSCLGASLTHTLFVLDEPTVGLHPRDVTALTEVMHDLRDKGNTLIVVEHEELIMQEADHLIDVGLGAGQNGGTIVYEGAPHEIQKADQASSTLQYLSGTAEIEVPFERRQAARFLEIEGVSANNLKGVSAKIPLEVFCCVTGVSGSGKSTFVEKGLFQNLQKTFNPEKVESAARITALHGVEQLKSVSFIDQSPLAKTPRSTPAVFLGAFSDIRHLFSLTDEAKARGANPGFFSFNSGAGRCERCSGNGFEKVEMQFLSDLFLTCPECDGKRYQREALEITYHGKNISEVLNLTTDEAIAFYENGLEELPKHTQKRHRSILKVLSSLREVGLGYLTLGQPLNTLSGGESQRIKIASLLLETATASKGKKDQTSLLILDEPTTGLHFGDIQVLLDAFQKLIAAGHSLLVVEHNLEVIKSADYVIDLGPEAGENGGTIVGEGTPEKIAKLDTPTGRYLSTVLDKKRVQKESTATRAPQKQQEQKVIDSITIRGARHHNLKNLDVDLPLHSFNVITGLSGSGKSTLAFDLVFAEGQRRFLDSMSPYARQFAEQLDKPDVDTVSGLPPTVAIEQRISQGGGKSTVATVTELYHFLRLLFAKLGTQHCPVSGEPVVSQTEASILTRVTEEAAKGRIHLMAPVVRGRKGFHTDVAQRAEKLGYQAMFVDQQIVEVTEFEPLGRYQEHDLDIIVTAGTGLEKKKGHLKEKVSEALRLSKGFIRLLDHKNKLQVYSTARVSPVTGESFEEPDPADFSFNSPRGRCPDCRGYGTLSKSRFRADRYDSALEAELAEEKSRTYEESDELITCPTCNGSRLKVSSNFILLNGETSLPHFCQMTVDEAATLAKTFAFTGREKSIARDILPEITQRLSFLSQVGLGYLTLDRSATTLSGGEAQRIRLAAQLGSNLQGVLYVLDEPTIGLHPRDNEALLDTLQTLQKKGNSLLIVEHDEETMARADQVIDLGPGAGRLGGEIMAQGSLKQLMRKKNSVTGNALKNPLQHPLKGTRRSLKELKKEDWLTLKKCHLNNLKDIEVSIPKGRLSVITGVSGSGKSTFMRGTLQPVADILKASRSKKPTKAQKAKIADYCADASGFQYYKYVFEVDQSPIGKTSRSCPATYVKLFDEIRKIFSQLPEAKMRGFTASRFSFNNSEGQCPECKGNGSIKLEMDFLPSTRVPCETCYGARYNPATLTVRYNGKTIGDVLQMPIDEAAEFFQAYPKVSRTLQLLADTGLGYLQIGQPSPTLSGGEAQRLKLVTELTKGRSKIAKTKALQQNLYLIEEPSIGLHINDVKRLIDVLHRLTDEGHTVVVVEHHPSIMAEADYILDFGPEAGPNGGEVCAKGTPEEVAKSKDSKTAPFIAELL